MKFNKRTIFLACSCLFFLVAIFVLAFSNLTPKTIAGSKSISVEIVFADKSSKTVNISTNAEYLRGALEKKKLISGSESDYGMFVTTVDGVTADESKQEWWCFTKGGTTLNTSVDTTPIADGDKYEITLTTGY